MVRTSAGSEVDLLRDLDRIRDQAQAIGPLCQAFCEYLTAQEGFAEAHLLIRDEESGEIASPTPDRPVSTRVQAVISRVRAGEDPQGLSTEELAARSLAPRGTDLGLLIVRSAKALDAAAEHRLDLAVAIIDSSIEHALTFLKLEQRNQELEAIFALDHLRDEHLPFDQMIDKAGEKILEYIEADAAAVVLFNAASAAVDIRFPASAQSEAFDQPAELKAVKQIAFEAFELESLVSAEQLTPAIGAAVCVPLILDRGIIGAFVVLNKAKEPMGSQAQRLLAAMASQIDTAIFEDIERQRIKDVFARYVAADVVEEMLKIDCDFFDGQRRELSVLFSDLRGFTAASERLDTDVLVRMLNEHLSAMSQVVLRNHGTLDKFIGDCVMAFWGAPVEQPDHALRAVRTAVQMRSAHEELLAKWKQRGLPAIQIGIGINTGEVFVGNIGDERKSSYTVIGDNVNLASRLEGVARGGEVLITPPTLEQVRDHVEVVEMEPVRVKGKSNAIALFNVTRLK